MKEDIEKDEDLLLSIDPKLAGLVSIANLFQLKKTKAKLEKP